MVSYRWVGVGWGNNVHVPVHTQAQQTLSSFLLSSSHTSTFLRMGWGGVITFMFLCTHRHSNLIIFLALEQTQALLFHGHLPVRWGGVGWYRSCSRAHTGTATFSSFLLSSRHRHYSFMITYRWGGVGWGGVMTFIFLGTHTHTHSQQPYLMADDFMQLNSCEMWWSSEVAHALSF